MEPSTSEKSHRTPDPKTSNTPTVGLSNNTLLKSSAESPKTKSKSSKDFMISKKSSSHSLKPTSSPRSSAVPPQNAMLPQQNSHLPPQNAPLPPQNASLPLTNASPNVPSENATSPPGRAITLPLNDSLPPAKIKVPLPPPNAKVPFQNATLAPRRATAPPSNAPLPPSNAPWLPENASFPPLKAKLPFQNATPSPRNARTPPQNARTPPQNAPLTPQNALNLPLNKPHRRRRPNITPPVDNNPCRVHVSGYPPYTQAQDLRHSFESLGSATVELMTPKSACLVFSSPAEAEQAVKHNYKVIVYGHFLTVCPYAASLFVETNKPKQTPVDHKQNFARSKEKEVIIPPESLQLSGDFCSQLDALLSAVRLSVEEAASVGRLYADLEDALRPHMPGCVAMPFGSITTGLGIKTSDADCYVHTTSRHQHSANAVNKAKKILQQQPQKFAEILSIPRANTPIVKFFHVPTNTNCDLSFKTPLGSQNSKLIGFLLQSDPRLIPMAVAIKYWAKVHQLSGTGRMTNYALTMLIIFYLQQIAILPSVASLQKDPKHVCIVDGWNTGFDDTPLPTSTNTSSISQLIGGFFEYYSKFNFEEFAVCPLLGTPWYKSLFDDFNALSAEFDTYKHNVQIEAALPIRHTTSICVQDPFEQSHNVASSINTRLAEDIKAFIKFAAEAYEKDKANECKEFLKIILLQKPLIIKAKSHPEYSVRLFAKIISAIASPDWKNVVREIVTTIFETLLKIKLTPVPNENKDAKINSPRKEQEKYSGTVTRAIWKRKQFTKLYTLMNFDFKTQQEKITEEVLAVEKNVLNIGFWLKLHFTNNPKIVGISVRLKEGEPELFKEFGKFFISIMQRWFVSLLMPYTKNPQKQMPITYSETKTDSNLVPNEVNIDLKKSLDSDDSPGSEKESVNGLESEGEDSEGVSDKPVLRDD